MEISQHRRRRLRRWRKKNNKKTPGKILRRGRRPAYCYSCVIKNERGARCWGSGVSWRGCPSVAFRLTSLPRRAQWRRRRGEGAFTGSKEEEKTLSSSHQFWAEKGASACVHLRSSTTNAHTNTQGDYTQASPEGQQGVAELSARSRGLVD